ncbi:MAG: thioredoxin 1 [Bacteroidota bacterium]|nr:thioredoxin 1 [Bacteroidota bacterium]
MTASKIIALIAIILVIGLTANAQESKPKITFLEIGSVSCIPCKKMQPIMKSIEKKYGSQIKVVFHDVRNDKEISDKYNIRLIPTQVFLDENGKEIHRHEGFYPETEIDKILAKHGLKKKS